MHSPPKKYLGQHFLRSQQVLAKILEAAEITAKDVVLEIGPGTGILTEALAEKAKKVFAVEKDEGLVRFLQRKFFSQKNLKIIRGDILDFNPTHFALRTKHYKVVANIPYYLTGRLLRLMFENWPQPKLAVLMLQKEVSQRICARPPRMSLLAASIQYFSEPKIVSFVPRQAFSPMPKVDSAIIRLRPKIKNEKLKVKNEFFEIVRAGFKHPRKLLLKNLSRRFGQEKMRQIFEALHLNPQARAAEISLETWLKMVKLLQK
jgi:16S rRNA (adenine1518-N6/adenine1519-N6)-dimethyltransferase